MVRIDHGDITSSAFAQRAQTKRVAAVALKSAQCSRGAGEQFDEARPADDAIVDQRLDIQRKRAIESDDAEGRAVEVAGLLG